MADDRGADEDAGGDADEPRRHESPPASAHVEPEHARSDEPAAEDAREIADERTHGRAVIQHADDDEHEQRGSVPRCGPLHSLRMISSASSRVNARSVSVSSPPAWPSFVTISSAVSSSGASNTSTTS